MAGRFSCAFYALILIGMVGVPWAFAENTPILMDKSHYSLFHPVPENELRDLDGDRPGVTDTPRTVDSGHFQIEFGVLDYTRSLDESHVYNFIPGELSVGLMDSLAFQVQFGGSRATQTHFRLPWNVVGNNTDGFALGLIPEINTLGEIGLEVPFVFDLPRDWTVSFMVEEDRKQNESVIGFHNEFVAGFVIDHPLLGELDGFLELQSVSSADLEAAWSGVTGFGLTYLASKNVQFDAESRFGLSNQADKLLVTAGVIFRR